MTLAPQTCPTCHAQVKLTGVHPATDERRFDEPMFVFDFAGAVRERIATLSDDAIVDLFNRFKEIANCGAHGAQRAHLRRAALEALLCGGDT